MQLLFFLSTLAGWMKRSRIESQDGAKKKYKNMNGEEGVYLNYTPMPITKIISPKYSKIAMDHIVHWSQWTSQTGRYLHLSILEDNMTIYHESKSPSFCSKNTSRYRGIQNHGGLPDICINCMRLVYRNAKEWNLTYPQMQMDTAQPGNNHLINLFRQFCLAIHHTDKRKLSIRGI